MSDPEPPDRSPYHGYRFPPDLDDLHVLRVVARNGFGRELAARLVDHLREVVRDLEESGGGGHPRAGFHH